MTRAHLAAVKAHLEVALPQAVFIGPLETPVDRYCWIYSNAGLADAGRLAGPYDQQTITFSVHSVGTSFDQAQWVADRVLGQLLNWIPKVDGWSCHRLRHASSQATQIDRDVKPYLYYAVDQFDCTTFIT